MVRTPLTRAQREQGERLGVLLRAARGPRSMAEVAAAAGVSAETLRKIETGRIATPAFLTVAALAATLGVSLDLLAASCAEPVAPRPARA
ncbi:helix-turn-helix domain-containing protein, partial [Frankia sp. AgKG'84/4]|uniref:helix-turn-helix domain-containing protein n=1 Tax=Frankia sp. AgKG'84/4 TaxID=573490 RepID=UPI00202A9AA0